MGLKCQITTPIISIKYYYVLIKVSTTFCLHYLSLSRSLPPSLSLPFSLAVFPALLLCLSKLALQAAGGLRRLDEAIADEERETETTHRQDRSRQNSDTQ